MTAISKTGNLLKNNTTMDERGSREFIDEKGHDDGHDLRNNFVDLIGVNYTLSGQTLF
jgi:hypothetical protein